MDAISCTRGRSPAVSANNARAPRAKHQAQGSAGESQQQTLCEQLPHDAPAAGSHGSADGDFPLAASGARQQQVRNIRTGNQQHQPHRAQQDRQRRPNLAGQLFLQKSNLNLVVMPYDLSGKGLRVLLPDYHHLRIGLRDAFAACESASNRQHMGLIGAVRVGL